MLLRIDGKDEFLMSHSVEVQPVPLENPGLFTSLCRNKHAKLSGRDLYHQAKWYIKSTGHGFSPHGVKQPTRLAGFVSGCPFP